MPLPPVREEGGITDVHRVVVADLDSDSVADVDVNVPRRGRLVGESAGAGELTLIVLQVFLQEALRCSSVGRAAGGRRRRRRVAGMNGGRLPSAVCWTNPAVKPTSRRR